jgi:hypothetical protein
MRYPLSYMIYSRAFDDAIYRRLWGVLSGDVKDERYAKRSREDCEATIEILVATKAGLPTISVSGPRSH